MRPDHTLADYAPPLEAMPVAAPDMSVGEPQTRATPFARMTFCFAWLFGLEPFLAGSATAIQPRRQSGRGVDRSL